MKIKNELKVVYKKIKSIFIRTDAFREHCENEVAIVLDAMGDYTTLDEVKEKIIQAGFSAALGYVPVIGGATVSLTADQIKTLSKLIVKYGHKAEKLMAKH
jgi:hypothetical protein